MKKIRLMLLNSVYSRRKMTKNFEEVLEEREKRVVKRICKQKI